MGKNNTFESYPEVVARIKRLLEKQNKAESELVDYLGINMDTIRNWKKNRSDSYLHYLKEISDFFHVTPNFLILGYDSMTVGDGKDFFSDDEIKIIDMFRKVKNNQKRYIMVLLQEMIAHP